MACYMGPTARVSEILEKLSIVFGTVASFDVLMQNFYKISQVMKRCLWFVTQLEGTLNQIRIKCPSQIADHEVPSHIKDRLFHGVKKHVRDSVRYLYSNPQTTYSKLVVAARRAESEMEETKVKAQSATATEVPAGSKEAMGPNSKADGCLTRQNRVFTLLVPPVAPRHRGHGRGWTNRNTSVHPSSHNGQTVLGPNLLLAAPQWLTNLVPNSQKGELQTRRPVCRVECRVPDNGFRCQGWGHMAQEFATLATLLNKEGGTQGNAVKPPSNHTRWTGNIPLQPWAKPTQDRQADREDGRTLLLFLFLNPTQWCNCRCANEALVVHGWTWSVCLSGFGAQVSTISALFCEELGLEVQPLGRLLELEGTGVQPSLTSDL